MARIALFGAAGAIGKSIAAALQNENAPYRVVGRSSTSLQKSFSNDPLAEIKTWNPDDPQSIRQAAEGIETIIYLVGVNYGEFQLHPVLMQRTIDGAIAAGVQRILLIGTVYPYGRPQSATVTEDHPRMPHTFKGKMRKEQEDLLFAAHQSGKLKACELKLPDFYGPNADKSFLWSTFQASKSGGRAQLVGPIDNQQEWCADEQARIIRTDPKRLGKMLVSAESTFAKPMAPKNPKTVPTVMRAVPSRSTCALLAPTAVRMPISLRLCATE